MSKKLTTELLIARMTEKWGGEFTILGTYGKNNREPVKMRHNLCKEEFDGIPNYLLNGWNGCPNCKKNKRLTTDEFKERLYKKRGSEFIVLGEYYDMHNPILVKHNIEGCSYEGEKYPADLLFKENGCPKCAGNLPLSHEDFLKRVQKVHNDDYIVLSKYQNMSTDVEVKHKPCGKIYEVNPNCFVNRKDECAKCKGLEKTHEEFLVQVHNLVGDEYIVLSEYNSNKNKVWMQHNKCGTEWEVKPNSFLSINGSRCPHCKCSKGNKAIFKFLNRNNFTFASEYRDNLCRFIRPLPFDFAIFQNKKDKANKKPLFVIEYQGKQHTEKVEVFGGENGFLALQRNDKIKKDFCVKNGIPIFCIPYQQFENLEKILYKLLKKYKLV